MSDPARIKTSMANPDQEPDNKPDQQPEPKPEPEPVRRAQVKMTDIRARPNPKKQQPNRTNIKFAAFATVTVLLTAGSLAALWPLALASARSESAALVREGSHAEAGEASTDFLLATWLDRHNTAAYAGLARTQITAGQPDAALNSLTHAGQGSEIEQLRVRTLIELGRPAAAANAAGALTTPGRSQDDVLLAVLAYENAGRHADAAALIPRLTSPEAAQGAARAQTAPLGLAAELYATGLLRSSSAILLKTPTAYERNLLIARIRYAQHTKPALLEATDFLTSATTLNPANIEARTLLAQVYRELGNTHDAQLQTAAIAKLQAGRP